MIVTAILKLTWLIFIQGPLALISAFNAVLEYLTGGVINDIFFGSIKEFQWNTIPAQFWWFVLFAFCLFSLIFTIQMIILYFKEAVETKTKFVLAIKYAVKGFAFMFLIPIFFFIANFVIQNIAQTVIQSYGNGSNIADYLWHIGDPKWNGSADGVTGGYGAPSNIRSYNMMAQLFGTWFMLFAIFVIGLTLIQKIVELFFLFIISPIIMIVMVVDDGKAAFTWKDMVIAKFLASTATLIGYYVFISVTQRIIASGLESLQTVSMAKPLFIILFLCGGALATMSFSDMIAAFLGEAVGIREGMASMKSTMSAGMMTMGAGKMTLRGAGFMKSKRNQKNSGLFNNANPLADDSNFNGSNTDINTATFRNATVGMASRSGIIGLSGLVGGAIGVGFGAMKAGTRKAWKASDRTGVWNKTKGVGRVIGKASVAPIVNPSKAIVRSWKNTRKITLNTTKSTTAKNLEKHKNLLLHQSDEYQAKANESANKGSEFALKNKATWRQLRQANKYQKNTNKASKYQNKHDLHYDDKSKKDV